MTFQISKPTDKQLRNNQDNVVELSGKGMWDPLEHNIVPGPTAVIRASVAQELEGMDGSAKEEPPIQEPITESEKTKGAMTTWKKVAKASKCHCDGTNNTSSAASKRVARVHHIAWDCGIFDNQGGSTNWRDPDECATKLVIATLLEDLVNPGELFDSVDLPSNRWMNCAHINVDDAAALQPCLAHSPNKIIKKMIKNTAQCALTMVQHPMQMHQKSQFQCMMHKVKSHLSVQLLKNTNEGCWPK